MQFSNVLSKAVAVGLFVALLACSDSEDNSEPKLFLHRSPYPMQHANPRASDFVASSSPINLEATWHTLKNSSVAQPCSTGGNNRIYCVLGWDPAREGHQRCNLRALDAKTGEQLWEDRINDKCVLGPGAVVTNPLIDYEGNLYVSDENQLASFTAEGQLRWRNDILASLPSDKGHINAAFGINILPGGELVTATIGDGWILVFDRSTGELLAEPFDLPSSKMNSGQSMPAGFLEGLMSRSAAELLYRISLGNSDLEVDNNVAVDPLSGLIFVTGGDYLPNSENHGALWALRYEESELRIAFGVTFSGTGGIATTPTVSKDGRYVVIADNAKNLVLVDVQACLALGDGAQCEAVTSIPIATQAGASPVFTDSNKILIAAPGIGLLAFDLVSTQASTDLQPVWKYQPAGRLISSVVTGFQQFAYFATTELVTGDNRLEIIDIETGELVETYSSGEFANFVPVVHCQIYITNNINFIDGLFGRSEEAGIQGWQAQGCQRY